MWLDRWYAVRDRLLASPKFQRWALALPLTRLVARRDASALFDLCAGFVYSQVLAACVKLRLFDILAEGPKSLPTLAHRLALSEERTRRLLDAAVALRLAERRDQDVYGLGALGAALLGNPGVSAMIEHHALLYADLADPVSLLRGERRRTALKEYWPYAATNAPAALGRAEVAPYTALMSASQSLVADEVLDAYPLGRRDCLLDVGGGDGAFLSAVAKRLPKPRLILFDLPAVAELARARFEAEGLADRAKAVGGDFRRDPLPQGADVVTLVRVLHDHPDDVALAILKSVRQALPSGGVLLVAEPMSGIRGAEAMGDAYFGFYLLAMGRGRPRRFDEIKALLEAAGLTTVKAIPTRLPLQTSLVAARAS